MKVGDLIKFSKEHYSAPGLDYTEDWIGIILEFKTGALNLDPPDPHLIDEMWIAWTSPGAESHVGHYDEFWWNRLNYEPFEVLS